MVGTVCFRLRFRGTSHCLTTVALSKSHYSSPHPYFIQVIGKPHVASPILFQSRSRSQLYHHQVVINEEPCGSSAKVLSPLKISCSHASSCAEGGHESTYATIWHGLLPSHHPSFFDQSAMSKAHHSTHYPASLPLHILNNLGQEQVWLERSLSMLRKQPATSCGGALHGLSFPQRSITGPGRFSMGASLPDGSWNVAWDARPARWLHGRDSVWLLFGMRNCFSTVSATIPPSPSHANAISNYKATVATESNDHEFTAFQPKEASIGYTVTGIPSDGRCLFRAIVYGACMMNGEPIPNDNMQQELADSLRNKVVDELVSRRGESEWFIEEDFDAYVKRMREPYVWGGEPELLMASHVLKMPITVHLLDKSSGELISVAEYGKDYGNENPIRVLYHGFGHYDVLQLESGGRSQVCMQ